MKTLNKIGVGKSAVVKQLHGEGALKRRIMDMGITKGVEIKVNRLAPSATLWSLASGAMSYRSERQTLN